jgi:hypothetical protein
MARGTAASEHERPGSEVTRSCAAAYTQVKEFATRTLRLFSGAGARLPRPERQSKSMDTRAVSATQSVDDTVRAEPAMSLRVAHAPWLAGTGVGGALPVALPASCPIAASAHLASRQFRAAALQASRLAHVQHHAALALEDVHAGRAREVVEFVFELGQHRLHYRAQRARPRARGGATSQTPVCRPTLANLRAGSALRARVAVVDPRRASALDRSGV